MPDGRAVASFLGGLALVCLTGLAAGHHHIEVVSLAASVVSVTVVGLLSVRAWRHRQLVHELDAVSSASVLAGMPVRMGHLGDAVFVAGLRRPTIYCDRRLPAQLTSAQLEAVLLHERAHQRAWDPARLLLIGCAAPVLRRLPGGRQLVASALARREIAADRYAIARGASRADLAAALLALPPLARSHVAGFTPAVDLRLQALLGDDVDMRTPLLLRHSALAAAGAWLGAAVCSWLLHDLLATFTLVCC